MGDFFSLFLLSIFFLFSWQAIHTFVQSWQRVNASWHFPTDIGTPTSNSRFRAQINHCSIYIHPALPLGCSHISVSFLLLQKKTAEISGEMIKVSAWILPDGRRAPWPRQKANTVCIFLIKTQCHITAVGRWGDFFGCLPEKCRKKGDQKMIKRCEWVFVLLHLFPFLDVLSTKHFPVTREWKKKKH